MAALTNKRSLTTLLLGLYQLHLVVAQQCSPVEGQPTCVCDTGGAGIVNLTSIASTDTSSPPFVKIKGPSNYMYSYNPCFGFSDADNDDCQDVAGCQYGSGNPASTGTIATETFQYSTTSAGSQLLTVRYSQGSGDRQMIVWLICDQSADSPIFDVLGEPEQRLTYEYNLTTKCACPGVCTATAAPSEYEPPVGYIGLVLIIVSMAAFVTYFIVGAIVAKFKMNKSGSDLIPNKLFWKDLPFLLKDGLLFVVKFFLYVGNLIKGRFTTRKYSLI